MIARLATFLLGSAMLLLPARAEISVTKERNGVDRWENDARFPDDTFRFVRLRPSSHPLWATDYPDSDLNFSFRLQQMTSIKVNPEPIVIDVLDPRLKDQPFLYLIETGSCDLNQTEAKALREHLLNGGFLMLDDFWGESEWRNTVDEMKKIFPDRPITELGIDHPVFNIVFPLKQKPQVPAIGYAMSGVTYEKGGKVPGYYGIFDEKGRMMVIICHNTDLGDGWEREGENHFYFKEFSEKLAYPMGINIVVYSMTH
jgi:hypothetical protein